MKRTDLVRHLQTNGCEFARDTGPHEVWVNRKDQLTASVPPHREINTITARAICKQLGISKPPGK